MAHLRAYNSCGFCPVHHVLIPEATSAHRVRPPFSFLVRATLSRFKALFALAMPISSTSAAIIINNNILRQRLYKSGATMLTHNYRRKFFFVDAKNSCTEEQAAQHFLSGPRYREKHFRYTKNAQGNDKLSILCGLNGITRVNVDVQQHISSLAKLVPENIVMYIHSGSSTFLRAVKRT